MKYEELLLAEKELYKESFYHFAKYACGFKDIKRHAHLEICEKIQDQSIPRKLFCLPRGTFKSSLICVAYPIWILTNVDPNMTMLIDSEVYTNSKNFIREIKAILLSDKIRDLYGDLKGDLWNQDEVSVKTRTMFKKEANITAGGLGTVKVGQHYNKIIGDDYNSNKNSLTPEMRKKVVDHYKYNISILNPNGEYVLVGTRYSQDDIIGHILTNELDDEEKAQLPSGCL